MGPEEAVDRRADHWLAASWCAGRRAKDAPAPKGFKPYEPGYLHVDVQYLPLMPDETRRRLWPSTARPAGCTWNSCHRPRVSEAAFQATGEPRASQRLVCRTAIAFRDVGTRYRTPQQLGLLERFHQTLKREELY
jgi:hypothetical protein